MKKPVGIVLIEFQPISPDGPTGPTYRVSQLRNTIEWFIGQDLDRKQVLSIIARTGRREVDVIVKGVEFEG